MKCVLCSALLKRCLRHGDSEEEIFELVSGWHLQTGDPLPPYNNGTIRLFTMRFCQYAQRTILVLKAKNIKYDIVFVNLKHKPEWLFDFSPKGTVPALEYENGKSLFDSTVINLYLDEKYPKPKLQSSDPLRRAQDRLLLENFTAVQSVYYTAGFDPSSVESTHVDTYHKGLLRLQSELIARGTTFLHGKEPGLVDYTVWPFLERFEALPLLGYRNEQLALDNAKYEYLSELIARGTTFLHGKEPGLVDYTVWPFLERFEALPLLGYRNEQLALVNAKYEHLLKYMEAMKNHPVVRHSYLEPQVHAKYLETKISGDPDFNMLTPTSIL